MANHFLTLSILQLIKEGGGEGDQTSQSTNPVVVPPVSAVVAPKIETPVIAAPTDGALAVGTISRQISNGILNYVLTTTDGTNYVLYNSLKWREIDNFTKSGDKNKTIAVYGDFYFNRFGVATGIKFTRFEIR